MIAIAAADRNWGIGRDGKLLVHLPGDLKFFKEHTIGKTLVMGRKTLESLPGGKPLPGRKTIVLSRNKEYHVDHPDCRVCTMEELQPLLNTLAGNEVMVAGGAEIYSQLLPFCSGALITKVDAAFSADRFFPELDLDPDWEKVWESEEQQENGIAYRWTEYRKKTEERTEK